VPGFPSKWVLSTSSKFVPMKAEFTFFIITTSSGSGVANDWNAKPGFEGWSGESPDFEPWATWMILCGDGLLGEVVLDMRSRYMGSSDLMLFSNEGLLRDGPQ